MDQTDREIAYKLSEILEIIPCALPFGLDDKIFYNIDEEGNPIGEPYSYNDSVQLINSISGVNNDLCGEHVTD